MLYLRTCHVPKSSPVHVNQGTFSLKALRGHCLFQQLIDILKDAGLEHIRFHDLRHTFATLALQNGVDIKTVSGMLGHFSAGFTLDTYAHVTTSAQKEAARTMGNVLAVE